MALVGEHSGTRWALTTGGDDFSASWDLDFPPSRAFIKVFLGQYFEFDDKSHVEAGLLNIRWRDSEGVDQTITFPSLDGDARLVKFHDTMTHVTMGILVSNAYGLLVWTLGFWD